MRRDDIHWTSWRSALGMTAYVFMAAVLLTVIVGGPLPARIGASLGLLGGSSPLAIGTVLLRREYDEGEARPSWWQLAFVAAGRAWLVLLAVLAYVVALSVRPPAGDEWTVALVAAAAVVLSTAAVARGNLAENGIERVVLDRAAVMSFYVTTAAAGVLFVFEVVARMRQMSALLLFTVAWGTFAVAASVYGHRSRR